MNDWFSFEQSPWDMTADKLRSGDTISAAKLLTLLEGEEEDSLGFLLEDLQTPQPQEVLIREELARILEELLGTLTQRQQMVLRLHFGMEDGVCHSLEQISIRFGVSKERVRQIERQAMERLQKLGAGLGLEDFLE